MVQIFSDNGKYFMQIDIQAFFDKFVFKILNRVNNVIKN